MGELVNTLALASRMDSSRTWKNARTHRNLDVLVVSGRVENAETLLRHLEKLTINILVASTIEQAVQLLSRNAVDFIFCEESLPDGSYRPLLEIVTATDRGISFVVTLSTGEWDEYLEALRLGATDVLRCPLNSIDVEVVMSHAGRDTVTNSFNLLA
jgi:DNA-binding NtrC family response regulator